MTGNCSRYPRASFLLELNFINASTVPAPNRCRVPRVRKSSEVRREYVGGQVYAMAGGSSRHNRIALGIAAYFLGLGRRNCRIYQEGMKLHIGQDAQNDTEQLYYYPDVMVVCNKPEPDPYFETEPCILVEVLSPNAAVVDLREKLLQYSRLPSLQTYLIVDADTLFVRHFWRDAQGHWQQKDLTGDGEIALPCLGASIDLPQIYRGVF